MEKRKLKGGTEKTFFTRRARISLVDLRSLLSRDPRFSYSTDTFFLAVYFSLLRFFYFRDASFSFCFSKASFEEEPLILLSGFFRIPHLFIYIFFVATTLSSFLLSLFLFFTIIFIFILFIPVYPTPHEGKYICWT